MTENSKRRRNPRGTERAEQRDEEGLYVVLVSVHGLFRGYDLELGRDADTGGQTTYVLELARALARSSRVRQVDLLTRRVLDGRVAAEYGEPLEIIAPRARIVRIAFGPRRYLRKEALWPHLDSFLDGAIRHFRRVGRAPDLIHAHYADAGYVGAQLAQLLGTPFVFTGHSLGRVKRERLLEGGARAETLEAQYHLSQRIEAEEVALENAAFVVASTRQEIEQQYRRYENYRPRRMKVIPPGVDLTRFRPMRRGEPLPPVAERVHRFLADPEKPMILALSRPDPRKNVTALVEAYAADPSLREAANLVLILGARDDIRAMEDGPRKVLQDLLYLIDRHDLYGHVAYPKAHAPEDVPDLYRLAARSGGVFVNPALTEPFGLTLLEAAASGLPVVATEDGGPREILRNCRNGLLVNPLDRESIASALRDVLSVRSRWRRFAKNGLKGVTARYSWDGHVDTYLKQLRGVVRKRRDDTFSGDRTSRLPGVERLLVCDIDNTLLGDPRSLNELVSVLGENKGTLGWGVATGRRLESAIKVLKEWNLPLPDLLITAVGTEIHYTPNLTPDKAWWRHIDYRWRPDALASALDGVPGLKLQPKLEQRRFKLSYYVDRARFPGVSKLRRILRHRDLAAKLIYSHEAYLDLLPIRASKGLAVRHLGLRWGISPERMLVAGDSGNDEEMLAGDTLGVVVGNYSPELERLRGRHRIHFAERRYAGGILEGIERYRFLDPEPDVTEPESAETTA